MIVMTGHDRRLEYEYNRLMELNDHHDDINVRVVSRNANGFANGYLVEYLIRSICAIDADGKPLYADRFIMAIDIPVEYPSVDAPVSYRFLTVDPASGVEIPHPWHPNIRYFGNMAGRVCLNAADTYAEIAWGVIRVGQYLRYERYHALNEPPYPEDQTVAAWVIRTAEPNGYI